MYSHSIVHNNNTITHNKSAEDLSDCEDLLQDKDIPDVGTQIRSIQQENKRLKQDIEKYKQSMISLREETTKAYDLLQSQELGMHFYQIQNSNIQRQLSYKAKKARVSDKKSHKKQADLKGTLYSHVFPEKKFVYESFLYDMSPQSLGVQIMTHLNIKSKEMPAFWADQHAFIEKCFQV